jgi:membrane protein YqaA with SNARE-associated domain
MLSIRGVNFILAFGPTLRFRVVVRHVFHVLAHLGGFGLLILSFVDSTPLYVPLGNDLLMIVLTANKHSLILYYALMAAAGSALGCLTVEAPSRKGGEKGLEKAVSARRLNYVKKRVKKSAAWALALGCVLPPPFPFTGIVAAAAALQYPRKRLLIVVFFSRLVRFLIVGTLGIFFGRGVLHLVQSPVVIYIVVGLIVISIGGSAFAMVKLIRRSRTATAS